MHKIIVIFLPILIGTIQVIINNDVEQIFSSMSRDHVLILSLLMVVIVFFIAIYSSQKKIKYFVSVFFVSIIGGNLVSLVILSLFGVISYPESFDFEHFELFFLQIVRFGALPSIVISIGLLTKPVKDIEENLSE